MIKNVSLLFTVLFLMHLSYAQKTTGRVCFLGEDTAMHSSPCIEQPPSLEDSVAEATLNTLLKPIGLHAQYSMRECSAIQNFAAIISENQVRYILYNKMMIDSIADPLNRHWNKIAIYLHELSHHLSGNTSNTDDENSLQQELYADEFSGTQMAKLKADLVQAEHFLTLIENPSCEDDVDRAHPCLEKRLNAVEKGWYSGMGFEQFYAATTSKMFSDSLTINYSNFNSDSLNYIEKADFFAFRNCVRSKTLDSCKVFLTELSFKIDLQSRSSSLTLKLTDEGKYFEGERNHLKIDTSICLTGHSQNLVYLLPGVEFRIDFPMSEYGHLLQFYGQPSESGAITGIIIVRYGGQKTFQRIAELTLRPK